MRQRIERFVPPSRRVTRIGILMYEQSPFERDAVEDFAATVRNEHLDVELYQGFTNRDKRLYDDICRVVEDRLSNGPDSIGRRILIVLTDGEGGAGSRSLEDAVETAQRHDVSVFVISNLISDQNQSPPRIVAIEASEDEGERINSQNRPNERTVEERLRRLCEETGGHFFRNIDKFDLFRAFARLTPLRQEYLIYYTPRNQAKTGIPRSIDVKLVEAEGRVHHKPGYVY